MLEERHVWFVPSSSRSQDVAADGAHGPAFLGGRAVGQNEYSRGCWDMNEVNHGFLWLLLWPLLQSRDISSCLS